MNDAHADPLREAAQAVVAAWVDDESGMATLDPEVIDRLAESLAPAVPRPEGPQIAAELLDAVAAILTDEPKSYWLRGPAVKRLREAYNAVVKEANR